MDRFVRRPKVSRPQTSRARAARKQPSAAEEIVWELLRNRKQGFKFKREVSIGAYRVDFYCAEARVALEMDGEQHCAGKDSVRDQFIESLGIVVFRIPNVEFFQLDPASTYKDHIEELLKLCEARTGRSRYSD